MNLRVIILLLLSLFPFSALHAQGQVDEPFFPCYREKKPSFNGGDANMFSKWVNEHKHYPEEAKKTGIEGRVTTQFTITKEGKLVNVRILRGIHPLLDEEAIRVIESAPQIWKPGENYKGEPIDVTYMFPVIFMLSDEERASAAPPRYLSLTYSPKEERPLFGGNSSGSFDYWIRDNLVYPDAAKKARLEGRVYLTFSIDEKGELVDLQVYESTNKLFEEEALRVVRLSSGKWTPGRDSNGELISKPYLYTIVFFLPDPPQPSRH